MSDPRPVIPDYYTAPRERPQSRLGIASAILAFVAIFGIVGLYMMLSVLRGQAATFAATMIVLVEVSFSLVGVVLGVAGLLKSNRRKLWAIIGAVLNAAILMLIVSLVLMVGGWQS